MASHQDTAEAFHRKVPTKTELGTEAPRPVSVRFQTASSLSPSSPVLRANPSPEVTDLACRLPLPTLFYRLEAVHLGDLLRIRVRSSTKIILAPLDFQVPMQMHRTPQKPWRFAGTTSISPVNPIPWSPSLEKKR